MDNKNLNTKTKNMPFIIKSQKFLVFFPSLLTLFQFTFFSQRKTVSKPNNKTIYIVKNKSENENPMFIQNNTLQTCLKFGSQKRVASLVYCIVLFLNSN